ncbi:MAG: phosphate ABC transporter ATP-binding protein PstB [Candidatus Brocadiales bacterium]|nr:phosphate ABC transporter ATP-binding protein PstB [Candidatus Brocadiales bacterium]
MKTPMQNTVLTAEKIDYNGANIAKRFSGHNVMAQRPNNKEVEAVDLSIYYGNTPAVNKVTLPFYTNCITAIIGPSGCGKSTLIKSINRVCEISSKMKVEGEILFKGKNVYDRDVDVVELRRRIGMVFQKPNPFPKSIYDNVAFGPRLHGRYSRKALNELVEHSLRRAALWEEVKDRIQKSALTLSGGQQQRLCIARALAVGPEVLLMDEPCSALDPIATAKIEELVLELKKQYTIILVTHNMQQAARISDYTGFLLMGELIEFEESFILFTTPKEKLTEDYITGRFG